MKSDYFRQQFEKLLTDVIKISNGKINIQILKSDELVTEFTIPAENRTERLCGILSAKPGCTVPPSIT